MFFNNTYKRFPPAIKTKLGEIFDDKSADSLKNLHEISISNSSPIERLVNPNSPLPIHANATSSHLSQEKSSTLDLTSCNRPGSDAIRYRSPLALYSLTPLFFTV